MRRMMYVPSGYAERSALHERKRIDTFSSPGSFDTIATPLFLRIYGKQGTYGRMACIKD
jgi:hypothetical protein